MSYDREPQYHAYAAIVGTFFAGLGLVSLLARRSPPATALDLVALSAATFKASRTLSRERVGSFLREPFVEGSVEKPAGEGVQRALGEDRSHTTPPRARMTPIQRVVSRPIAVPSAPPSSGPSGRTP